MFAQKISYVSYNLSWRNAIQHTFFFICDQFEFGLRSFCHPIYIYHIIGILKYFLYLVCYL